MSRPEIDSRVSVRISSIFRFSMQFLITCIFALSARAEIPYLEWEDTTTVDAPVSAVSEAPGSSSIRWNDSWYLVYVKHDDIYLAERVGGVWQLPVQVSDDPALSTRPLIQEHQDGLIVIWEDERTGHSEIWFRSYDGTAWDLETCLTEDAVPSSSPSFSTNPRGWAQLGLVVWEEGTIPTRIAGRWLGEAGFDAAVTLASGTEDMTAPTVSMEWDGYLDGAALAWVDVRHGTSEIYTRRLDDYRVPQQEVRVTDLPGPATSPVIVHQPCCGDWIRPAAVLAFTHVAPAGVAEVWTAEIKDGEVRRVELRSADDGVVSNNPNLISAPYVDTPDGAWCGETVGAPDRLLLTWTDDSPTTRQHHLLQFDPNRVIGQESLTTQGLAGSVAGFSYAEPRAGVGAAWIEERNGQPTLVSRIGDVLSCSRRGFAEISWFTVGPAGFPPTRARYEDICTGDPAGQGLELELRIDGPLDEAIEWDSGQEHPNIDGEVDEDGVLEFSLRGGGCAQVGRATVRCRGWAHLVWLGVKSPDIDGDCKVTQSDLTYVQSQIGSDDFCADIDGSGLVDEADVAIVQTTFGDACSGVTDVDPDAAEFPKGLTVRATPNPSQGVVHFSLYSTTGSSELRIVDSSGRLVVDLGSLSSRPGWQDVAWDGRDGNDREVASGVYFAEVRSETESVRTSVLLLR